MARPRAINANVEDGPGEPFIVGGWIAASADDGTSR